MFEFDSKQSAKLNALRASGVNPYPSEIKETKEILYNIDRYHNYGIHFLESLGEFNLRGRLRFKNEMGSIGFGRIEVGDSIVQFSIAKANCSAEQFNTWKKLDIGDLVSVTGIFTRMRSGELTMKVSSLVLSAKCIAAMPDKVSGLVDTEQRQRMRYLDLITNVDSRNVFIKRSKIISSVRNYMEGHHFMEVETPTLQNIPGGANAKPFVTHHNALDSDFYMRIAPELYLKRLVVGGFERVFEIGKNFRNEGVSQKHNPEFTMIEFYQAYATYTDLMKMIQELFLFVIYRCHLDPVIQFGDVKVDYSDFKIVKYEDLIKQVGVDDPWNIDHLNACLVSHEIPMVGSVADAWDKIFSKLIEPKLINPTFVTHHPVEISPLAKCSEDDPRVTDRFELFIAGMECANGFNELNDPIEQANRFMDQVKSKESGNDEAMYFDDDYIRALTYGMPPTAGAGIGIDRMVMLLTGTTSIRDVILFPAKKV